MSKTSAEYSREWKKKNPERRRELEKRYRESHKEEIRQKRISNLETRRKYDRELRVKRLEKIKNYNLNKRYGISIERYTELFNEQGGRCAICGKPQTELEKSLSVDHNHFTGEIRGLLCTDCNFMIGRSGDDPDILRKGADYLEQYE